MKITTVSLSRTIPTGPYMNDKIGMEASVEDGDTPERVLNELLLQIDQWHRQANPHLHKEHESMRGVQTTFEQLKYTPGPTTHLTPSIAPLEINIQHERIQIGIENAAAVEELKAVKADHPLMPASLMNAYNKKMEELTK